VLTANGAGMTINHIGHSTLRFPVRDIHLNNVLHVPSASKNLVSAHRLVKDNNAFLELHPRHFSLKDQVTRKTLLEGRCEEGLYPLKPYTQNHSPPNKQVLGAFKPSTSLWHSRLGHASSPVVQRILSRHKLSFSSDSNKSVICDVCQMGKAISYPILSQTVCHPNLLCLCSLMYGDRHQSRWVGILIMSVLLMILANSPGSICCVISLKFSNASVIFNTWLSASLIIKFLQCSRTGEENTGPSIPSLSA